MCSADKDTDPPTPGAKHVSLCTTLNRPFSRGTIHATSTDPLAQPAIDPHYFEEDIGKHSFHGASPA